MDIESRTYSSARDDRDYLLEYISIDLENLERVDLLGVPVDNVSRDEAVAYILDLVEKKRGPHHVLFLDPLKLMRLRKGRKLHHLLEAATMVLADGSGLPWAARKQGTPLKERIPMISLLMDLVRAAWKKDHTIYFFGSRPESLERVFFNFQKIFPGIRIIGRQGGRYNPDRESLIKESMRKSSPDIIFLGMGFPKQELWLEKNWSYLSNAVVISVDDAFDILSGRDRRAPDWVQNRGLVWFWRSITRPWRVDRLFLLLHFVLIAFWRSLRKSSVKRN